MNPVDLQLSDHRNNLITDLHNLKISNQNEIEQSEPTAEQKEIAALKAEVQFLKAQLENKIHQVIPKANLAPDQASFDNTFPDLSTPVTIHIGGASHTFPLSILKMAPAYHTVDQNVTVNGNYKPEVISSLVQFLTLQFYGKNYRMAQASIGKLAELTDEKQEMENFEQLHALAGNFGIEHGAITEFLKLSVQSALTKDLTGQQILKYIRLANHPKYPWLFETIKSAITAISLEKRNLELISTFYKNLFSYLNSKKNQRPEKNEVKLLVFLLFKLLPFHLDLKAPIFQNRIIPSFCNAWIFLHPFTFPRLERDKEKIFLEALNNLKQTPEIQIVSLLFNGQLTSREMLIQLDEINNNGNYLKFCCAILLLDRFLQDKNCIFPQTLSSISKNLKGIVQKEPSYIEPIFEILEDPFFPKTNNSYKSPINVNPETFPLAVEEVIELFSEILDFIPNNKILIKLIEIYEKANKREVSLRLYEKFFHLDPSSENVFNYLSYLERIDRPENHYASAIDFLKRAINALDPKDLKSINKFRYKRAYYLYALNNKEEAIEELTNILKTNDIENLNDATNLKITILNNL